MALDTQLPPWLQRNIAPREPFDPTPWLQERYNRLIQAKTLPLQLQGMELANKAHALTIEHQGLVNDQINQEMDLFQQDLPKYREWMSGDRAGLPPAFESRKAQELAQAQLRADAESDFGKARFERQTQQIKRATEIEGITGKTIPRNPDGSFDQDAFTSMDKDARDMEFKRKLQLETEAAKVRNEYRHMPAPNGEEVKAIVDPVTKEHMGTAYWNGMTYTILHDQRSATTATYRQIEDVQRRKQLAYAAQDWEEADNLEREEQALMDSLKRGTVNAANQIPYADRKEIDSLNTEISHFSAELAKLDPNSLEFRKNPDLYEQRTHQLNVEIARRRSRIRNLSKALPRSPSAPTATPNPGRFGIQVEP